MTAPQTCSLINHSASPCATPLSVEVTTTFDAHGDLMLSYRVTGNPDDIELPTPQPPGQADKLWQHTCCEAFVTEASGAYREFNFSPSGQWANYRFTGYRERDSAFVPAAEPQLALVRQADGFALHATLPAALLPSGKESQMGLSVVIEAADGSKGYWALAHCAAQPDFHLSQSFTLPLKRSTP